MEGLWVRGYKDLINQMKKLGFNTIRIPISNQMLRSGAVVTGVDYTRNNDLVGLSPLQCLDMIVNYCGISGMRVILNRYSAFGGNALNEPLWYIPGDRYYTDSRFIADWTMLALRYRNTAVIGADLWNTPRAVTWGDGNVLTDWLLASQRAGNAILAVNNKWLIIVEGTAWGSSLTGVQNREVILNVPNRVVYSVQLYSNDVAADPTVCISQLIL